MGAAKHTQTCELGHAVHMCVEKGMDEKSCAATAQSDIEKYYDNLDVIAVPSIVATCVCVCFGPMHTRALPQRGGGTITGSKVANLLSRIPTQHTIMKCAPYFNEHGYKLPNVTVSIGLWVDNAFAVARSVYNATAILDRFEDVL